MAAQDIEYREGGRERDSHVNLHSHLTNCSITDVRNQNTVTNKTKFHGIIS